MKRILIIIFFVFIGLLLTQYVYPQIPGERKEFSVKDVNFAVVYIPTGIFRLGSPESEHLRSDNENFRQVDVTIEYWMMETEVTQELYEAVMGVNPSIIKGDRHPVENVSWHDANEFCIKLSDITGLTWKLPTEEEWEYACRARTLTAFFFENKYDSQDEALTTGMHQYICQKPHSNSSDNQGHCEVGQKLPNSWGLYDMLGNVWEWCADWYTDYPGYLENNFKDPWEGTDRVLRGGSWKSHIGDLRAARRIYFSPNIKSEFFGFRAIVR